MKEKSHWDCFDHIRFAECSAILTSESSRIWLQKCVSNSIALACATIISHSSLELATSKKIGFETIPLKLIFLLCLMAKEIYDLNILFGLDRKLAP